jgi:serine protease Do
MKKALSILGLSLALAGAGAYCASSALVFATTRAEVPRELVSYRDVVKRVLPAVVSIEAKPKAVLTRTQLPQGSLMPFDNFPGLPDSLRKELERFRTQPFPWPDATPGRAFGSGFVVDPNGVILTNDHVIRGAEEVTVLLQDGRKFTSRDIKRDPRTDLAVVRIQVKEPLPFLKLGNSDAMEIGDRVLAVGAPLGLTGTVTAGIVSAKGRNVHLNMYEDFIQTDAAINPGNSGGPLVNLAGEVIGINSAIKSGTGGFQGIGLAIASNLARDVLDQLRQNGSVHRGYLGVQVQALAPEVAARLGVAGKDGVVLSRVMPGGPAAKAGLRDGDILTEIAAQPVKDPRNLQRIVAGLPTGKKVELAVVRDGNRKVVTVTVESQPESFGQTDEGPGPAPTALGKLGAKVANLTPMTARQFGYSERTEGVLVAEVEPESGAGLAGLQAGMLITKVDGQHVKTVQEFGGALERGSQDRGWLLQVRTPRGGTSYVLLKSSRG